MYVPIGKRFSGGDAQIHSNLTFHRGKTGTNTLYIKCVIKFDILWAIFVFCKEIKFVTVGEKIANWEIVALASLNLQTSLLLLFFCLGHKINFELNITLDKTHDRSKSKTNRLVVHCCSYKTSNKLRLRQIVFERTHTSLCTHLQ